MSEHKKPTELKDSEVEKVSGGRWKSVQDDGTDDPTSPGKGKTK